MDFSKVTANVQTFFEDIRSFDYSELSQENIGAWPAFIKNSCCVLVFILSFLAGYKFVISDTLFAHERAIKKEAQLKDSFQNKAFLAANLNAYREQMKAMEASFGALVSQLPSDTEVPGLLEDITQKGELSGLKIKSIDLDKEVVEEFYIQLPINIEVEGSYHDMGAFVSGVASLPRIVTLTNFQIETSKKNSRKKVQSDLTMSIKAYTYRYKDIKKKKSKRNRRA